MAKIISTSGDGKQIQIMPTFGYSWKMCKSHKGYFGWFIAGIILFIFAAVGLVTWMNSHPIIGGSYNLILFAVLAASLLMIFLKPSQVMVNNEIWVDKEEFEKKLAKGEDVDAFYFKRYWY